MTEDQFWELIDLSKLSKQPGEELFELLYPLSKEDVLSFGEIFSTKMIEAYSWELWAVPYLAYSRCSDDTFENFRAWLIMQGHEFFHSSIQAPISLARYLAQILPSTIPLDCEHFLNVVYNVYEAKMGQQLGNDTQLYKTQLYADPTLVPFGNRWSDNDVRQKYPQIAEIFSAR